MSTNSPPENLIAVDSAEEPTVISDYDSLPISALSSEILVEIFDRAQRNPWGEREAHLLIKMASVCRHSRGVALDAPSLWAYVISTNAGYEMATAFLARSKQAKLDISLAWWMTEDLALAVASQIHRIKNLSFNKGPKLDNLLMTAAPVLQVFEIHNYPIPELLFSGIAPQLLDISIHDCRSVSCSAIPTCPLRFLSIRAPEPRLRLPEVVEMLSRLPTLESVSLHTVFDDSDIGAARSKAVDLPKLNWMYLGELSIRLAIQFFKQVRLNAFTRISTIINDDGVTTANITELLSLSATAGSSIVQKLNIRQDSGWFYGHSHLGVTTTSQIENWINHRLSWDETMSILKQLPLHRLEDLQVTMCKPPPPPEIWTMMANAPIRRLRLGYNAASIFIPFISSPTQDDAIPFASLRSLVLEDLYDEAVFSAADWDRFCDIVRVRTERGFGLESLRMKSPRPADEFPMETLEAFIPTVSVSVLAQ